MVMEITKDTPIISVRLSKSGKAILIYDENGLCWMTSAVYMKMLIEGKAKNNMIAARLMSDRTTNHFKPTGNTEWDDNKIRKVDGDQLGFKAEKQRVAGSVKVKGDW